MKQFKSIFFLFSLLFFSCPSDDSVEEDIAIEPITYELVSFTFTQQTSSSEDALSYEIKFFNSNNFSVSGFPQVTTTIGGGATATYSPKGQCLSIEANSFCLLTYNVVDDNPQLFPSEPIEFVSADYILE
ncbi:hypothetical protein [Flavivirga jejuensis]|uniref:Lipoprotein n=1 Tax=Flavivirga jejuensis TaxID=870487 RepID=A0ABT8WLW4_9FLAO|nr:hypothetical protein [Flavivirga jejuensis]MDO5973974.1 hypothetical protein [Flavivirga jejuensis]